MYTKSNHITSFGKKKLRGPLVSTMLPITYVFEVSTNFQQTRVVWQLAVLSNVTQTPTFWLI